MGTHANDVVTESTKNSTTGSTTHAPSKKFVLSKYDIVDLEEYMYAHVACVVNDPILDQSVSSLQWLQKRIGISYSYHNGNDDDDDDSNSTNDDTIATETKNGEIKTNTTTSTTSNNNSDNDCNHVITITLRFQLRLPSLLHPKLNELCDLIIAQSTQQAQEWWNTKQNHQHNDGDGNDRQWTTSVRFAVNVLPIVQPPIPIMSRFVDDAAELLYNLGPGLTSVTHCIAVTSCKGGVGKSTIAVNLAYELARAGGRIGVLDLDLYGPSLPVLVRPTDCTIRRSPLGTGNLVYPITHEHVKLLSLGFVNTNSGVPGSGLNNGASIMKGPMAVKVVSQLLKGTDWGSLDVLILDLPPGTGDVQLAVLQQLQLSGAVAVSTPSKLATTDTRKGIEMFTSLGVPTIAVVENMSYFDDDSGKRHYPFGQGFNELQQKIDIPVKVVQLPISILTNDANDTGIPLTIIRPKEAVKELSAYKLLSDIVSEELLRLQYGSKSQDGMSEFVSFDTSTESYFDVANVALSLDKTQKGSEKLIVRLYSDTQAVQFAIPSPSDLRSRDPKTGDVMPDSPYLKQATAITTNNNNNPPSSTEESHDHPPAVKVTKRSPSVIPTKVERRGRYGFAVEWADGATIIYSMKSLAKAAGGKVKQ